MFRFEVHRSFPYATELTRAAASPRADRWAAVGPLRVAVPASKPTEGARRAYDLALHFALLRILEVEFCRLLMEEPYLVWQGLDVGPHGGLDKYGVYNYRLVGSHEHFSTSAFTFHYRAWMAREKGPKADPLLEVKVEVPKS